MTEIGEGYVTFLLHSVDYIQEVMLDSFVPPDRFGLKISYSYLPDKLLLLKNFLDELRRVDVEETKWFRDELGKSEYLKIFGNYLVSLEIIWELYEPVRNIIRSVQQRAAPSVQQRTERWISYDEVLKQFESLLYLAAKDNHNALGIWPKYVRD